MQPDASSSFSSSSSKQTENRGRRTRTRTRTRTNSETLRTLTVPLLCFLLLAAGCRTKPPVVAEFSPIEKPADPIPFTPTPEAAPVITAPRTGDEIVIAGQLFHTGTRIVLWSDTNGYNAYSLQRHFTHINGITPSYTNDADNLAATKSRYSMRRPALTNESLAHIRTNGWDLPTLQNHVDQFVLHYDVCGTSRQCFFILHDRRCLSVHFMLDLDGTIYQTLDAQERASHATTSNDRSVGIEIANIGAYSPSNTETLDQWYDHDTNGQTQVILPERFGDGGILTPNFIARPARMEAVTNVVQGRTLVQYDFTPEQYTALARLTAALSRALPKIKCDAPRNAADQVTTVKLPDDELEKFQGVLGHYHIQLNKTDPGPAFDWEKVLSEAKRLMNETSSTPEKSPQSP